MSPPLGTESYLRAGVVGGDDRTDDGESETVPARVRGAVVAQALERQGWTRVVAHSPRQSGGMSLYDVGMHRSGS